MGTLANIVTIVMLIITVSSLIAAVTPTPKDDVWIGKLYKLIDICALNIGKAKQKSGDQENEWSNYIKTEKYLKRNITIMFFIKKVFGYASPICYGTCLGLTVGCRNV